MAGSLDDRRTVILGKEDYEYLVVSREYAEIWVSPMSRYSRQEIADELRRVAAFVESTLL
jgi:hypothetical protein